jgi:hypothetical protein
MIVFFLAKKRKYIGTRRVEKHRTGAFRTRDQTLCFFSAKKKDNHYENESTYFRESACEAFPAK